MKVGIIVPQGWLGEYDDWDSTQAWRRTEHLARLVERLGFESIWLFDHFHTKSGPTDDITFESFTALAALAALTSRVRLGHTVVCAGFRNPALVAKMVSTMDVISGGRMELGIGAGWKEDEWRGYGYEFPGTRERLARLEDDLEVISRMLAPGRSNRATYAGPFASVQDAINVPKPVQQPRVPIMVGGNGPKVTWPLAARMADELNLDGLRAPAVASALPLIRACCDAIGRDPASLGVSVHLWPEHVAVAGEDRVATLRGFRELGIRRVMCFIEGSATSDAVLESFAADAHAAGAELV